MLQFAFHLWVAAIQTGQARLSLTTCVGCQIEAIHFALVDRHVIMWSTVSRLDEAVSLISSGRLEQAKSAFENLLLEDPKNADALYYLGMCFTELGEPERALNVLQKTTELAPEYSNAYVALGTAQFRLGNIAAAEQSFLKALQVSQQNPDALRNLGAVFGKKGEYGSAFVCFQRAYDLQPRDAETVYGLAYTYQQLNDYANAHRYYREILQLDAPRTVRERAETGLREIAEIELKSKGLRDFPPPKR